MRQFSVTLIIGVLVVDFLQHTGQGRYHFSKVGYKRKKLINRSERVHNGKDENGYP